MRFYDFEEWLGSWRWYHWLLLLAGLTAGGYVAASLGWIQEPPPGGWQPKGP